MLIQGYWFCMMSIMILILVVTGWGTTIHQHIKLYILFPALFVISLTSLYIDTRTLLDRVASLNIHVSFVIIAILLIVNLLLEPRQRQHWMLFMYILIDALLITMIRAGLMLFPELKMWFNDVHLAIILFCIVFILNLTISDIIVSVIFGFALSELLLVWQQKSEYVGNIGNLHWWDQISITLMIMISLHILVMQMNSLQRKLRNLWIKRMKS